MIKCYIDGACEPANPGGTAAYGFIIYQNNKKLIEQFGTIAKKSTNNVAEYGALYECLTKLIYLNLTEEDTIIYSDSQLVINQMRGNWKIKKGEYVPYCLKCKQLLYIFLSINFQWIPREENSEADFLSRRAYT